MSLRESVVTYQEIARAVNQDAGRTAEEFGNEARAAARRPAEEAAMLAALASALQALERAEGAPGVLASPQHQVGALLQSFLAQRSAAREPLDDGLEVKFDNNDLLGWVGSFFNWWRRIRPHRFLRAAPEPGGLPGAFRMGLLGDWGTGLYGAPVCAKSIENDPRRFDFLMHLGDVYYSGTEGEIQERFLDLWPKRDGARSFALNSNHEMYSGGNAYFKMTLKKFGQDASYFALRNDHWLLVGLDTAYRDHDLHTDEVKWLNVVVTASEGRKVILFSHHQPYSLLDNQGPKLIEKLGAMLGDKRLFAWYWGHEHRCAIYEPHPAWGLLGRCVGHGGFPYFRSELGGAPALDAHWRRLDSRNLVPAARVLDGPNPFVRGRENDYGPHGYMTLEFDGPRLHETAHLADGTMVYERDLV